MLVSCTSNLLEQMYGFRKCTKVLLRLILSLQDLRQNQSPETIPINIVVESVSHMTILFEFTRMMNVRNQTCQTFFWGPLGDSTSKFVHRPWNIRSTNAGRLLAFQDNLRVYFWQLSNRSQFFFLEMVVVKEWSCNFVQLLGCFVRQLAISLHTFLCMTFHIIRPWRCTQILQAW